MAIWSKPQRVFNFRWLVIIGYLVKFVNILAVGLIMMAHSTQHTQARTVYLLHFLMIVLAKKIKTSFVIIITPHHTTLSPESNEKQ